MIAKISLTVCLIAMVAMSCALTFCYTRVSAFELSDLLGILIVIGPYLLYGLMVWRWRGHRGVSIFALALILILASLALSLMGLECYEYHHTVDPYYETYQRPAGPIAVLLPYPGVVLLGLVILIIWLKNKLGQKDQRAA